MEKIRRYVFISSIFATVMAILCACVSTPPSSKLKALEFIEIVDGRASFVLCSAYDTDRWRCVDEKPVRVTVSFSEYISSMDNAFGLPHLKRKQSFLKAGADKAKTGEKKKWENQLVETERSIANYVKWRDAKVEDMSGKHLVINPEGVGGGSLLFLPFRSNKAACPDGWEWSQTQKCCSQWMNCRCEMRTAAGLKYRCKVGKLESFDRECFARGEVQERQVCLEL